MSFLFDNLFQKQNPELAGEMAQRGLIFDRISHRWVKNPENRAQPKNAPKTTNEIPGMEGPFSYKTGNSYYYSPKEGKYYDAKADVFMPRGFDPQTGQYSQVVEDIPKPKNDNKMTTPSGPWLNRTKADETLHQLGGRRFVSMTGAKNIVGLEDGLQFSIPRSKDKINKVRVTLDPNDTYKIEFYSIQRRKLAGDDVKRVAQYDMIYAKDLAKVFKDTTGLETKF